METNNNDSFKQLPSGYSRSVMAISWSGALLMGLPFVGCGVLVSLASIGLISSDEAFHVPRLSVLPLGIAFFLAGILLWTVGFTGWLQRVQAAKRRQLYPGEPWLWDYPWKRQGIRGQAGERLMLSIFVAFIVLAMMSPFNWWIFVCERNPIDIPCVFIGVTIIADIIFIFMLFNLAKKVFRKLKYGRFDLVFTNFPIQLGEETTLLFTNPRGIGDYSSLTFTLRYVEERFVTKVKQQGKSNQVVRFERYRVEQVISEPGSHHRGDPPVPVTFKIPVGEYHTRLSERPPWYWELEVKGDNPGLDFHTWFLVPVYERIN